MRAGHRWLMLLAMAIPLPAGIAHAEDVAVTFDDLPVFGTRVPIADAKRTTRLLLGSLTHHRIPAIGFVNEIQLEGSERRQRTALLACWLDAGMDLGNHSYSHLSLTATPVDTYIADVARGEQVTRSLMAAHGKTERYYRHPYLETGKTAEARARFECWLAAHGYRVAPVTMENSDWQFADRYDEALERHDALAARRVRTAYLDYTKEIVAWYRGAALRLLGRRAAFVFLLHASRLNAASLGAVARTLRRQSLRFVTLDRALDDPAYRIADTYVGPDGDGWLTRWSLTLHRDLPWPTLPKVPVWIAAPADPKT